VWVITTTAWTTGGGTVPNAADYAIIELRDNAQGTRIGDVTGYLGYQTQRLHPNHAHLLGYPLSLDAGQKLHQVTAESFSPFPNNTVLYGSDMTGGSSGGPWIQNFGAPATGQAGGLNPGRNLIIGVTSFGSTSLAPKRQGSSILDARFTQLLTSACTHRAGNC
jgi:hypothetical protein